MGMRLRRRRNQESDPSPGANVVHEYPDAELGHFKHPTYSMTSGMKYILVLSILLWWLPTFGQMIAGYIGGRRSGGPWRGVVAAVVPVLIIVVLAWGLENGFLAPWLGGLAAIPSAIGGALGSWFPPAAPYIAFVLGYLGAFVAALKATLAMGANGYLVTIVFAYIGGVLADQARREAGAGRGASVGISITQPLLHPFRPAYPAWEGSRAQRFDDLHKIPVHGAQAPPDPGPTRAARAHKVDARSADSGGQEAGQPPEHAREPKPKALKDHDKEVATRRFVERALRQYEAAHRR